MPSLGLVHEDVQFSGNIYAHLKFTVYGRKQARTLTGGCLFTQSHAGHVIGLQDERSLMKANVLDTALANGRSSVFSSTGKAAYRFSDVLLYV